MSEERGEYCPHSETGIMPRFGRLKRTDSHTLFRDAVALYRRKRHGDALAVLKVLHVRGTRSKGVRRLYQKVNAALGRSATH